MNIPSSVMKKMIMTFFKKSIIVIVMVGLHASFFTGVAEAKKDRCIVRDVSVAASSDEYVTVENPNPRRCNTSNPNAQVKAPHHNHLVCYKSGYWQFSSPFGTIISGYDNARFALSSSADRENHLYKLISNDIGREDNFGTITFDVIFPHKWKRWIQKGIQGVSKVATFNREPTISIAGDVITVTITAFMDRNMNCYHLDHSLGDMLLNVSMSGSAELFVQMRNRSGATEIIKLGRRAFTVSPQTGASTKLLMSTEELKQKVNEGSLIESVTVNICSEPVRGDVLDRDVISWFLPSQTCTSETVSVHNDE